MIPSKTPCVKFLSNKCTYSPCNFLHESPSDPYKEINKIPKVCLFHLKGHCFYNENCWYLHPPEPIYWRLDWFKDRAVISFNTGLFPERSQTIKDLWRIGKELAYFLRCLQKFKGIMTLMLDFDALNFSNDYVFNIPCCKTLLYFENLQWLQLSFGSFSLLLYKIEELELILNRSIKLKSLTISDNDKFRTPIGKRKDFFFDFKRIRTFLTLIKQSYLDFFEIEVERPLLDYEPNLKAYIFMLISLTKTGIRLIKLSFNEDLKVLVNNSKLVLTMNFNTKGSFIKEGLQDLLDFGDISFVNSFKEATFNYQSDWFSAEYTHITLLTHLKSLSSIELDFRRVNVSTKALKPLWIDLGNLNSLSALFLKFPNSYIDRDLLKDIKGFLCGKGNRLKGLFIRMKAMFVEEEVYKEFLMGLAGLQSLQRLELKLDFNLLYLWAEDKGKSGFFNRFLKEFLRKTPFLLSFSYAERTLELELTPIFKKWLLLKGFLLRFCQALKGIIEYKVLRKELFYETFFRIHKIEKIGVFKGDFFHCIDQAENESEGAFYERFLEI